MGGVLLSWLKSARLPGRRDATLLSNFNNRRDIPPHTHTILRPPYKEYVLRLANIPGVATPMRAALARFDRNRKKKLTNLEPENPHHPDAQVTNMKNRRIGATSQRSVDTPNNLDTGERKPAARAVAPDQDRLATQGRPPRTTDKRTSITVALTIVAATIHADPTAGQVPDTTSPPAATVTAAAERSSIDGDTSPQLESAEMTSHPIPDDVQTAIDAMRREVLDHRATTVTWWLTALAILLALFGFVLPLVVALFGFLAVGHLKDIEAKARTNLRDLVESAECLLGEIRNTRDHSAKIAGEIDEMADNTKQVRARIAGENPDLRNTLVDAVDKAVALRDGGKTEKSIEQWRSIAIMVDTSDRHLASMAWFSVGQLLDVGREEERVRAYSSAIRLRPTFARAYNNRAVANRRLRLYGDAMADYNEAIRLRPDFAGAYNNRGSLKRRLGQHEGAMADYNTAIHLEPAYAKAYNNRGNLMMRLGRCEEAMADFNAAIRADQEYTTAYYNRGNLKTRLGRFEEAIADYDAALLRDSGSSGPRRRAIFSAVRRSRRIACRKRDQAGAAESRAM